MTRSVRCGAGLLAGILGGALVLLATATSGPGISPDAAAYVSAAESVAAGRGYVKFDDELYTILARSIRRSSPSGSLSASIRWYSPG